MNKNEVKLLGEHNLQNICAALTVVFEAQGSVDPSRIVHGGIPQGQSSGALAPLNAVGGSTWIDKAKTVLSSFSGLEHRLEFVRALDGVKYYNDSFATTPESAVVALKTFSAPKVVILGGSDKGLSFDPLADEVAKGNVRKAVAIGTTADKIVSLLKEHGFTNTITGLNKMTDIVAAAREASQPGDVVLLSTGCASFGLFKDYKDRGEQFKKAVQAQQ
jgi:UDP-N-acetylmuramoylalanine--D-glutamate ligase